jgi:hypothetical protein
MVELLRWRGAADERQQIDARYNMPQQSPLRLPHVEGNTLLLDLVGLGTEAALG